MGQLSETWRKQAGMTPSSGEYAAFNTVIFVGLLLIQFGLGMQINLFVTITRHHPGAGAANFVPGVLGSVSWAIAHGPAALAIHAALGLAILIGAIHNFLWNLRWGTRGTVWATGIGLLLVLAAGLNGGGFPDLQQRHVLAANGAIVRRGPAVLRDHRLPADALARSWENTSLGQIQSPEKEPRRTVLTQPAPVPPARRCST